MCLFLFLFGFLEKKIFVKYLDFTIKISESSRWEYLKICCKCFHGLRLINFLRKIDENTTFHVSLFNCLALLSNTVEKLNHIPIKSLVPKSLLTKQTADLNTTENGLHQRCPPGNLGKFYRIVILQNFRQKWILSFIFLESRKIRSTKME